SSLDSQLSLLEMDKKSTATGSASIISLFNLALDLTLN
ncbi:MAG: hypothetical protein ACJAV0_000889, partial [Shewanella sp.]